MADTDIKKGAVYRINNKVDFSPTKNKLRYEDSGTSMSIEPLLSRVLAFLIENRSRAIPRSELQDRFWTPDVFSDDALTKAISKIRKLLGSQSYIETINKVGYEWIAHVEIVKHRSIKSPISYMVQFDSKTVWTLVLVAFILLMIRGLFFPHH